MNKMVRGFAASAKSEDLHEWEWNKPTLRPDWVDIDISHCGICHSDIHLLDDALGITKFPFVPGHEMIGTISEVGAAVHSLKPGDRVGVGWQSGSCRHCEYCDSGNENCCPQMESTCLNQYGGYASSFQCDQKFAVKIPSEMSSATAAPLMCGGVTVYQPLRYYNVKPNDKVAVIGIGGLGHIAIQFLSALGCEVTAISSSTRKKKEAEDFGADYFVSSNDGGLAKLSSRFDVILNTVSADLALGEYFNTLKPMGKFIMIGLGSPTITLPGPALILGQRTVGGSWIGSPSMIGEMLDFAARNSIKVKIEQFPMSDVNKALRAVRDNKVGYRAVLVN